MMNRNEYNKPIHIVNVSLNDNHQMMKYQSLQCEGQKNYVHWSSIFFSKFNDLPIQLFMLILGQVRI